MGGDLRGSREGRRRLRCPRCDAEVRLADATTSSNPCAICGRCDSIFAIAPSRNRVVVLPRAVYVENSGGRTTVTMRWFRPAVLLLIPITAFVCFRFARERVHGFFLLLMHAAVAAVAYGTLVFLANRSVVTLDGARLRARHGPLPFHRGAELATELIEGFFVPLRRRWAGRTEATSYCVLARVGGSSSTDILKAVMPLERAVAIQRPLSEGLERIRSRKAGGGR